MRDPVRPKRIAIMKEANEMRRKSEGKCYCKCILCEYKGQMSIVFHNVLHDVEGMYKIVKCPNCELKQINQVSYNIKKHYDEDRQDKDILRKFGRREDDFSKMLIDHAKRQVKSVLPYLTEMYKEGDSFKCIDVGGGKGFFASELKKASKFSIHVDILEPGHSRIEVAKNKFGDDISWYIEKPLDESIANSNLGKYDIVTVWHVLEHILEPCNFIRNCIKILKPEGYLFVEVPNDDCDLLQYSRAYQNIWYNIHHVSYFTPKTLRELYKSIGFFDVEIRGRQRYGLFNYINWIQNETHQVECVDYYYDVDRHWLETLWVQHLEKTLTTDAIYCVVKK